MQYNLECLRTAQTNSNVKIERHFHLEIVSEFIVENLTFNPNIRINN